MYSYSAYGIHGCGWRSRCCIGSGRRVGKLTQRWIPVHQCDRWIPTLFFLSHLYFPVPGQAVVSDVVPSPPRFLLSNVVSHRVQQSHCFSIFHRVLLTHAIVLSASQFGHRKKSQRIYTSVHSAGLELTKLTYTRLEDNLIRHGSDRHT